MRNGARSNWADEIVRNAAIAPTQKQQYKKYSRPLHSDQPLTESDDDEPKKIRSYIKPNKNINSYSEGRQKRVFSESMQNRPLLFKIPKKAITPKTVSPIPRVTSEVSYSELNVHETRNKNKSPTWNNHSTSVPPTSNFNVEKHATYSTSVSRRSEESVRQLNSSTNSHHDVRNAVKRHNIPKPPPLPQKRAPQKNACRDHREAIIQPPPPKKNRGELKTTSSTKESSDNLSGLANTSTSHVREGTSSTVEVETLPWNEHANLAYLYTRKAKIFTLDTLPAEESWYVNEFHKYPTDVRNTACVVGNESYPSSSSVREGDGIQSGNAPTRKSCLSSSKRRAKRRISFSEEVSTYFYEIGGVEEEDEAPSNFKNEPQKSKLLLGGLEPEPSRETAEYSGLQRNDERDHVIGQQQRSTNFPHTIIKQEVMEQDDEIQFLFAGNPQYLAELHRNLLQHNA